MGKYEELYAESARREALWGIGWPGHPDALRGRQPPEPGSVELDPERWRLVAHTTDPDADYSYDDLALMQRDDGVWALLRTTGCSCPSPTETWGYVARGTIEEIARSAADTVNGWPSGPFPAMRGIINRYSMVACEQK